jgi:hypothetical protein
MAIGRSLVRALRSALGLPVYVQLRNMGSTELRIFVDRLEGNTWKSVVVVRVAPYRTKTVNVTRPGWYRVCTHIDPTYRQFGIPAEGSVIGFR